MDPLDKSKFSLEQVMISLSAIAYAPFHSISMLQENQNGAEALEYAWSAIWWGNDNSTICLVLTRSSMPISITMKKENVC